MASIVLLGNPAALITLPAVLLLALRASSCRSWRCDLAAIAFDTAEVRVHEVAFPAPAVRTELSAGGDAVIQAGDARR